MAAFAARFWRVIAGAAVLLLAAAGFLVFGLVGFGNGPLTVAFVDSAGTVPRLQPSVVLIPIAVGRSTAAVIDSVSVSGGEGYSPPRLLAVLGDRDESCSGIWYPLTGSNSFQERCATDGTVPLMGHAVPVTTTAVSTARHGDPAGRAIEVAVEVAGPGPGHCWTVDSVSIHYHIGHRHYTAVASESMRGCAGPTLFARQRTDS